MKLNEYIDHTKLGPLVNVEVVNKIIEEAIKYDFMSICIPPTFVKYAKERIPNGKPLICTVIGFPHGTQTEKTKAFETKQAILDGADEIDMVANINYIKSLDQKALVAEIKGVIRQAKGRVVKVIVETALLTDDEIKFATKSCIKAKATFIKTSTGYSTRGASLNDIKIMKKVGKDKILIKASGGIRTKEDALAFINAGASRIGTSQGVNLLESKGENNVDTSY